MPLSKKDCQSSASQCPSSSSRHPPHITSQLKGFYFTDEKRESLMDCLLPASWARTDPAVLAQRVRVERCGLSRTKAMVFFTLERLIMKYSLDATLALPRAHPVFVFDSALSCVVKELYLRIKRDVVDKHKTLKTFASHTERERFRAVAQYFTMRTVVTTPMFLSLADKRVFESERDSAATISAEQATLYAVIPYVERHARLSFAARLEEMLPRCFDRMVVRPLSLLESEPSQQQYRCLSLCRLNAFSGCTMFGIVTGKRARESDEQPPSGGRDGPEQSLPKKIVAGGNTETAIVLLRICDSVSTSRSFACLNR